MNLNLLSQAIALNSQLFKANTNIAISLDSVELKEQKEIINWFSDGGIVEMSLFVASKQTEKSFVHFSLIKESVELNIGMVYLPELRKPSKKRNSNGFAYLFGELMKDAMAPKTSDKMQRDNKSMILYSLPLFKEESFVLKKGYSSSTRELPEKFNTVEKCLTEMDLQQYEKFRVS